MGKDSKIGWTHHTFNPWWGCEKPLIQIGQFNGLKTIVSPECVKCYAETWDKRCGGKNWGRTAPRRFFGEKHWEEPYRWDREAKEKGERHRVFCLSMGDILEDRRDLDEPRERVAHLVRNTPNLDWLLLTKRADQFERLLPDWLWQLRNVWPGVTAGIQATADLRIPHLLRLKERYPHLIAWVSCEPMLGWVSLKRYLPQGRKHGANGACKLDHAGLPGLDWAVIGGESGAGARMFDVQGGRALAEECQDADVPVFWKQFGDRPSEGKYTGKGDDPAEWPEWARVQQMPEVRHA